MSHVFDRNGKSFGGKFKIVPFLNKPICIATAAEEMITTSASPLHHAAGKGHLVIQEPPVTMASTASQLAPRQKKSEKIPATVIDVAELGITDFGWNEDNIKLDFITGRKKNKNCFSQNDYITYFLNRKN